MAGRTKRIRNRRAFRDYDVQEKLECGIELKGTEVKSIRSGNVSLDEGFARVERDGQLWLHGVDIGLYKHAPADRQHEPKRPRKLLAHKRQIEQLRSRTESKGISLVPLSMYFRRGICKVEIAVGEGKRRQDKRESIKKDEADRAMRRAMSRKRIG